VFGGRDISAEFPWLGQAALYAVNETVGTPEVDLLVAALREVVA